MRRRRANRAAAARHDICHLSVGARVPSQAELWLRRHRARARRRQRRKMIDRNLKVDLADTWQLRQLRRLGQRPPGLAQQGRAGPGRFDRPTGFANGQSPPAAPAKTGRRERL